MNSKLYTGYEHIQQKKKIIIENILEEFGEQDQSILLLNYHTYTSQWISWKTFHYVHFIPTELKATFISFLKSMNTKEETTTPKSLWTEMRSDLIDVLNASMLAVLVEPTWKDPEVGLVIGTLGRHTSTLFVDNQ